MSPEATKPMDFSWRVRKKEDYVDKHRNLQDITIPKLPSNVNEKHTWDIAVITAVSKIDRSTNECLNKWISNCTVVIGSATEVIMAFHQNSQVLPILDRHLGGLCLSVESLRHDLFSTQFAGYAQWCRRHNCSPRGRVLYALISLRFRTDAM